MQMYSVSLDPLSLGIAHTNTDYIIMSLFLLSLQLQCESVGGVDAWPRSAGRRRCGHTRATHSGRSASAGREEN